MHIYSLQMIALDLQSILVWPWGVGSARFAPEVTEPEYLQLAMLLNYLSAVPSMAYQMGMAYEVGVCRSLGIPFLVLSQSPQYIVVTAARLRALLTPCPKQWPLT